MNDLAKRLRDEQFDGWSGDAVCVDAKLATEAAERLEAQEELIKELASCLQWMVDNDETNEGDEPLQDYDGKTWNELNGYWIEGLNRARSAISKASKSNPNTPERNDE